MLQVAVHKYRSDADARQDERARDEAPEGTDANIERDHQVDAPAEHRGRATSCRLPS